MFSIAYGVTINSGVYILHNLNSLYTIVNLFILALFVEYYAF